MADQSSSFLLSILLKLKDDASKGLDTFTKKLDALDKKSQTTLPNVKKLTAAIAELDKAASKDFKVGGLDSLHKQVQSIRKDIGAAAKDLHTLQSGGQSGSQRGGTSRSRPYKPGDW